MNLDELKAWINEEPGLRPHAAFLLGLAKPCVGIGITPETGHGLQSRFAGRPMVAPGFVWPTDPQGIFHFLGQINFADIDSPPAALPRAGLLSLFYKDWGPNTPDDVQISHDVIAHFHADLSQLALYGGEVPEPCSLEPMTITSRRIAFDVGVDIPRAEGMLKSWPFDFAVLDARLDPWPEADALDPGEPALPADYLLGHPSFHALGQAPLPGPGWVALLSLDSNPLFNWIWSDGHKLMVFIEADRLAARDFSQLRSEAG